MQIILVDKDYKDRWNNFVAEYAGDGGILQSWQWGDFQKSLEKKIFRFAVIDSKGEIVAAALVVRQEVHFENFYLYCPRGPVVNFSKLKSLSKLFEEMKSLTKEEKIFMLRLDPAWILESEEVLTKNGFRKSDFEVQPKCSLIVDISKSEEDLLAQMKQKVRYNINLASKRGVKIRVSQDISDVEAFWQLMKQTSKRDGFSPHPKEYYKKMFEAMVQEGVLKLLLAEYENKIVAANLVSFFGKVGTYLHGASSDLYREAMGPYLLQWHSILEAKKVGCKFYDFGGVNGRTYTNEKWAGITRFKSGFAPEVSCQEFVGGYELVLNPFTYSAYKFVKQIRG